MSTATVKLSVEDLLLVAASFGTAPAPGVMPNTDVNGDGVINNKDMLLVLAALEAVPAAPALDTQWTVASLQRLDHRSQATQHYGRNVSERHRCVGTVARRSLAERDGTPAELPKPVQPGDMDSLSIGGACGGNIAHLRCEWWSGTDVGVGASNCGNISQQKPCGVLGW